MTTTDTIDLFSLDTRRHRVVEWQAPGPVAKAAAGLSGLETMCAIRDGILPPPPMARLIGFEMGIAEPGRIVMELDPDESLENTIGLLHGATAAALLDTAYGLRDCHHAAGRSDLGYAGPQADLPSAVVGTIRQGFGGRQSGKTRAVRPAMPKASFAMARAILQCTRPPHLP